jgi:hypothetical protein
MAAYTVKCNSTGSTTNAQDCTTTQTVNLLSAAPWNDASSVIGNTGTMWTNRGPAIVSRFNRLLVGAAALSGTGIPPVPADWMETLLPSTTQNAQIVSVSTLGLLGIVGTARTSDERAAFGIASGGSQGMTGIGYQDDSKTSAASATVGAGGSGYASGAQSLTVLGGTCTVQPIIAVTVSGGAVTAVTGIASNGGGACTTPPANPAATSGGGGAGATLNVTYSAGTPIACGMCAVAIAASGTHGISINQFDANNSATTVDATPFALLPSPAIYPLLLTAGAYAMATTNVTGAIAVGPGNTTLFRKGFIFAFNALDGTIGRGGAGVATEMARGQSMRWLNSGGGIDGEIYADAGGLHLVTGASGATDLVAAWSAFTASPTCGNGTVTTNSARAKQYGKTTFVQVEFTITALGSCTSALTFTLPNTSNANVVLTGQEIANTNNIIVCRITGVSTFINCIQNQGASYAVGSHIIASGVYENQ